MRGMESLLSSMIGVDPAKMQEMMSGFIENAAYLAKGIDETKNSIANIENRIAAIEDKIPPVDIALAKGIDEIKNSIANIENRIAAIEDKIPPVDIALAINDERQNNVESNN